MKDEGNDDETAENLFQKKNFQIFCDLWALEWAWQGSIDMYWWENYISLKMFILASIKIFLSSMVKFSI